MLESGDMYFGLSRTFFGTPQDGEYSLLNFQYTSDVALFKQTY